MLRRWCFSFIAASLMFMAGASPGRAQVAKKPLAGQSGTFEIWRGSMLQTPLPKHGCFHASYPSTGWTEVPCVTAPPPNALGRGSRPPRPDDVGNGEDFSAFVPSGGISQATGSFTMSNVTTESDSGLGVLAYSLQLNSNSLFTASQYCLGCTGWEQFVFVNNPAGQSNIFSGIFIQYWLFGTPPNVCPGYPNSIWRYGGGGCWLNSPMTPYKIYTVSDLTNLTLQGAASSVGDGGNGSDVVLLTDTATGVISATSWDSTLNLSQYWTTAEFNIFGAGDGSAAIFNNGATLGVKTSVILKHAIFTPYPTCLGPTNGGFTGESTNFTLMPTCLADGYNNAIQFMESVLDSSVTPPSVTTLDAAYVYNNGAELSGIVYNPYGFLTLDWFQVSPYSDVFDCKTNPGTANSPPSPPITSPVPNTLPFNANSIEAGGLSSGTTNYFVACAMNAGGLTVGNVVSFTTSGVSTTPYASAVTSSTATLNDMVNPAGVDTQAWFQYSTTNSSYLNCISATLTPQQDVGSSSTLVAYSANISGLISNTTYYFVACASTTGGSESATASFTTSQPESVSTPSTPTGPTSGTAGTAYTYNTGGASDSLGNPVQYQFNWGDGTSTGWLPVGTTSEGHHWSSSGSYSVTAQAESATNPSVVSATSAALTVTITTGGGTLPDLVFSELTGPNTGNPGGAIYAAAAVTNQGTAGSGSFQLEFYFSPTSNFSPATAIDTGWGCAEDSLNAGDSESCIGPIGIPATLAPGTWYLAAAAEINTQVVSWGVASTGPVIMAALPTILGTGSDGNLYSIIPSTGATIPIGALPTVMSGIAYNGTLYALSSPPASVLYTINPNTGAGAPVGIGTGLNLNALAFGPNGTLYAAGGDSLYTINTSTGGATLVGNGTGSGVYQSSGDLAFVPGEPLYLTSAGSSGDQLFEVSPVTGQGTLVGSIGFSSVLGLAYYNGTAYGFTAGGQVLTINQSTGEADEIASYTPGFNGATVLAATGTSIPSDFSHNGHPDVIWEEPTVGWAQIWYLGGPQGVTITGAANLTQANPWQIVGIGDFNGDGNPDVVWQDPVHGAVQVWYLGGPLGNQLIGAADITSSNPWRVVSVADFNGDGHPDLLWQDPTSGFAQIWYLGGPQGTTLLGAANLDQTNPWRIVGTADFNGDGIPDVLWQDPVSGAVQIWYMGGNTPGAQGSQLISAVNLTGSMTTKVVAIADFDLDGHPDVVFQDPITGAATVYYYTGAQGTTPDGTAVLSAGNPWYIAGPH